MKFCMRIALPWSGRTSKVEFDIAFSACTTNLQRQMTTCTARIPVFLPSLLTSILRTTQVRNYRWKIQDTVSIQDRTTEENRETRECIVPENPRT